MLVTNLEIWQAREPLQELLKEPWPVKTAYWLAKLARKCGEQYADIDGVRVKLIKQYGASGENGQVSISPDAPNWPQFAAQFNELMELTVDIPIDRVVLPDSDLQVTPVALMALEPFVEVAGT